MYGFICVYVLICVCMNICLYVNMHVYKGICIFVSINIRVGRYAVLDTVFMYVYMYSRVWLHVCT